MAVEADSSGAATASWLVLLIGGLLSSGVLVALYQRLGETEPGLALWGLLLGLAGAYGSAAHAGFALAADASTDVPSQTDPRGLATFGITGLAVLVFSLLIHTGGGLPRGLGTLGLAFGVLLVLTYLGRLVIVDPNNLLLLGVAAVTGLVVHPWWFAWLGLSLLRTASAARTAAHARTVSAP